MRDHGIELENHTIAPSVHVIPLAFSAIAPEKLSIEPPRRAIGIADLRYPPAKCPLWVTPICITLLQRLPAPSTVNGPAST